MLKRFNKSTLFAVVGFAAGVYVGQRYSLKISFEKAVDNA